MPSQLTQLYTNFGKRVPDGAIPLAYVNIPTPDIGQHVKLVGTGKYTIDNIDGISVKSYVPEAHIIQRNITSVLSASSLVTFNLVSDPSFLYGFTPATGAIWNVISGNWNYDTTNGRTFLNSLSETLETPAIEQGVIAAPYCAAVDWSTGSGYAQLISNAFSVRSSGEQFYSIDNVAYQLSLWIASDPVGSDNVRRSLVGNDSQIVSDTRLTLSVLGCNATGGIVSTLWTDTIGWPFFTTREFLIQPEKTFLRFRSPFIVINNSSITTFKIKIEGIAIEGMYFDDVRISSYSFLLGQTVELGGAASWTFSPNVDTTHQIAAGDNLTNNPEFQDNTISNGDFTGSHDIPGWTAQISQAIDGAFGVLAYKEVNNSFSYGQYVKEDSPSSILHYIYSWRTIYKNNLYQFTQDFCNRYFNTEHRMVSSNIPVEKDLTYGLNYVLQWAGARTGITLDMDPTIRGAFAEPFRITYLDPRSGFTTLNINKYGSLIAIVQGVNATGGITETPLTYTLGPQQGNLPNGSYSDSRTGWNYTQVNLPTFKFTNTYTVSGKVTFKFRATIAGINTVTLNQYNVSNTGSIDQNYGSIKVFSFSNKISADRLYTDSTDAWRIGIKDGIFERAYTLDATEPSGSWLRQVGYVDGDALKLIYTVPEYNMGVQWIDPNSPGFIKHLQEAYRRRASLTDEKTIWMGAGDIIYINEVLVNGVVILTGTTSGSTSIQAIVDQYPNLLESINPKTGYIKFKRSFNDNDIIEVSYFYRESRYIYRGYYDGAVWRDLDLNPAAGHRWHFGETSKGEPGFNIVNSPVILYLLPTAAYKSTGDITGSFEYHTAFELPTDKRPSSFVRHIAGLQVNEGTVPGYSSAVTLGKIFIVPPGSINDVDLIDIRSRGGGLPEDYTFTGDFIEESRLKVSIDSDDWLNTYVHLYDKDYVTIKAYGWASGSPSGNPFTITPSGSMWAIISENRPASGDLGTILVGNSWESMVSYSYTVSGGFYLGANQAPTGIVFLKIINPLSGTTGEFFVTIRIKRKTFLGSNWDIQSWDGEPVMLNGVVVFEVPSDVLTGSNGYRKMTAEQVEQSISKHVAAGVFFIVKYT